jgi:serine/threonine-protein kinase RsbW
MIAITEARPMGHPVFSETLPCEPRSAGTARRLVAAALAVWDLGTLTDDGSLVVTELLANATQHTRSRVVTVSVSLPAPGLVRIAVQDESRALPLLCTAGDGDVRGRGLALVYALTVRWGADRLPTGKCVWGELDLARALCRRQERAGR